MILETDDNIMGCNIHYLRNKKRLSRAKFANMFHMSRCMLHCIENGNIRYMEYSVLADISDFFHVSLEDILSTDLKQQTRCR